MLQGIAEVFDCSIPFRGERFEPNLTIILTQAVTGLSITVVLVLSVTAILKELPDPVLLSPGDAV